MTQYPPEPLRCSRCGIVLAPGTIQCPRCLAALYPGPGMGPAPYAFPGQLPPASRNRVGMIAALLSGLVLLLVGVSAGAVWLISSDGAPTTATTSSTTSPTGPEDSVSRRTAAQSLTAAIAALHTSQGTRQFCVQAFAFGRQMVYADQTECVDDWNGIFSHFSTSERSRFAELTIPASVLHSVDKRTLVVRWSEVSELARDSSVCEALAATGLGLVLQENAVSGSWQIIGTIFDDGELGTVPDDARRYLGGENPTITKSV